MFLGQYFNCDLLLLLVFMFNLNYYLNIYLTKKKQPKLSMTVLDLLRKNLTTSTYINDFYNKMNKILSVKSEELLIN